ncbi:hypothetical protein FRC01_009646, partial [Tulasnella sp. 417]
EFFPPSFPSDLMTSTPAPLTRQKPPHIMPVPERPSGFSAAAPSPGFAQTARFKANAPIRPIVISRPLQAYNFAPRNSELEPRSSPRRSSSVVSDPEAEEERPEPGPEPDPEPEPEPISLSDLGRVPTVDDLLSAPAEKRRLERMAARPVKKLPRRSESGREDDGDKWHQQRSRAELSQASSHLPTQQRSMQRIAGLESQEPSLEMGEPANEKLGRRRSSLSSSSTASSHQPRDADGGGVSEGDDVIEIHPGPPGSRSSSPSADRLSVSQEKPKSAVGALKFNNLAPLSQSGPRQALAKSGSARNAVGASDPPGAKERLSGAMPQSSSSSLGGHAAFQSQFDVERSMNIIGGMLDEDVWP